MTNRIFRINRSDPRGGSTTGRLCLGTVGAGLLALCLCTSASAEVFYTMVEPCDLALVNTDTGITHVIGPTWGGDDSYSVEALTFGPDGALYATVEEGCHLHGNAHQLATIDPGTAEVTVKGDIGDWVFDEDKKEWYCQSGYCDVDSLAFGPDGTLYGVAVPGAQLITINTDTGAGTAVGTGLGSFNFVGAIEFLRDGTLVGVDFGNGGGGPTDLLTIDPATGLGTLIDPVGFDSVEGLSLARDGQLFGMADALELGPGSLIEIDPTTAAGTFVQSVPASGTGFLDGLASCSDPSSELVYFSSGDRIMRLPSADCGTLSILFDSSSNEEVVEEFLGLNYGPDQWLYFCARGYEEEGLMGRIDPADPLGTFDILYDSSGSVDGPDEPECGWFTSAGHFMFTDSSESDGEVWMIENLAGNASPPDPVHVANADSSAGQLTQYINGDLLVVIPGGVSTTIYPTFVPDQVIDPENDLPVDASPLITAAGAAGIAKSFGYIFVSTNEEVQVFDSLGDDNVDNPKATCLDLGSFEDVPLHLASTINGHIYTGTFEGRLIRMDFSAEDVECVDYELLLEDCDYDNYCYEGAPPITGVAVTETSDLMTLDLESSDNGTATFLATFDGSNQIRLTADSECYAEVEAFLTPCSDVETAIGEIDPVLYPLNSPLPVPFWGDNGFCYTYETIGLASIPGECTGDCTCPGFDDEFDDGLYELRVDMYADTAVIYRIGVCEDFDDPAACETWVHSFNLPLLPVLETTDPPVGGRRKRGSRNFVVRSETAEGASGVACGFRPPLTNTLPPYNEDPIVSQIGTTIPVKTRLPKPGGNCTKGKWDKSGTVMFTVFRLEGGALNQVDVQITGVGYFDDFGRAILKSGSQKHLGWNTSGLEPGTYVLTVEYLTLEAPPFSTEVVLVE